MEKIGTDTLRVSAPEVAISIFSSFSPFVFGIDGVKKPTKESLDILKKTKACGVILFAKNIETPKQVRGLINSLEDALGKKLLVMIDHEGGLICRFSKGATHFPGNFSLGKMGGAKVAFKVGEAMAEELLALGINVNLAPVLDVLGSRYNPGITIRAFGSDARLVSLLGSAMIRGMQAHGLSATAKHFPGKGSATQDAHETLPTIKKSRDGFMKHDLVPFGAAIKAGVNLIMSTHVYCPSLDLASNPEPATFSRKIINDLLKGELGFKGVTITDDLGMGAVTERVGPAEAALRAASAGHDILLICHNVKAQKEAFLAYQEALNKNTLDPQEHAQRLARIQNLIEKPRLKHPQKINLANHQRLCEQIAAKTVRVVRQGLVKLPLSPKKTPNAVIFVPDLSPLKSRFSFERETENLSRCIAHCLKQKGLKPKTIIIDLNNKSVPNLSPPPQNLGRGSPIFIFFCFDATSYRSQAQVLKSLEQKVQQSLVVILIRNPWDLRLAHPKTTVIDALGFRAAQLQSSLNTLFIHNGPVS